jgi:hypothetical protein
MVVSVHVLDAQQLRWKSVSNEGYFTLEAERLVCPLELQWGH